MSNFIILHYTTRYVVIFQYFLLIYKNDVTLCKDTIFKEIKWKGIGFFCYISIVDD